MADSGTKYACISLRPTSLEAQPKNETTHLTDNLTINEETIMNKFAIATAIAAIFAGSSAFAAVGGQTSGEISVVDLGTNLNLVDGEQAARVGEITETCNNPEGYSVSFKSDNGGFMTGPLDAQSFYTINYDSIEDYSLESAGRLARELPRWNAAFDLTVNVTGDDELPAGGYKDLVTVEIAAL